MDDVHKYNAEQWELDTEELRQSYSCHLKSGEWTPLARRWVRDGWRAQRRAGRASFISVHTGPCV